MRSHGPKPQMLGRKLHRGTSKTSAGQGWLVRPALQLVWMSHCAFCVKACMILYHVTGSGLLFHCGYHFIPFYCWFYFLFVLLFDFAVLSELDGIIYLQHCLGGPVAVGTRSRPNMRIDAMNSHRRYQNHVSFGRADYCLLSSYPSLQA